MHHPMGVRAFVKLTTLEKTERHPDFANIGGFTVRGTDGHEYIFDWVESDGHILDEEQEDGRLAIEWNLCDFDFEHFLESNPGKAQPDWQAILDGEIIEVYYEAGYIDGGRESESLRMEVTDFVIYDWNDKEVSYDEYPFSETQIDDYNRKVTA